MMLSCQVEETYPSTFKLQNIVFWPVFHCLDFSNVLVPGGREGAGGQTAAGSRRRVCWDSLAVRVPHQSSGTLLLSFCWNTGITQDYKPEICQTEIKHENVNGLLKLEILNSFGLLLIQQRAAWSQWKKTIECNCFSFKPSKAVAFNHLDKDFL